MAAGEQGSRTRRGRPTRAWAPALAAAVVVLLAAGCGASTPDASSPSDTSRASSTRPVSSGTTYPEGPCVSRMPGEILTAEEAVVRFSRSLVCPGYVTVVPGTPVTWKNQDTAVHTITITEGSMPGGAVITSGTAEPGQTWIRNFDSAGVFTYLIDAIPSFRGTVEVTTAGESPH